MAKMNKRPKGKPRSKFTKGDEAKRETNDQRLDEQPMHNDFAWYNKNPLLTEAVARVPFPYRPGMSINTVWGYTNNKRYIEGLPGVMALNWIPSIGYSNDVTSPASIAAKELYANVRSKFSGSLEADAPDFMIYLLALDSIFGYIGSLKRVYRILNAFTPQNFLVPDSLLGALLPFANNVGQVVDTLREEKTQFWAYINQLIGMTKKFVCPAVFDYFNRHYWMNDNVYLDDASPNAQMYAFVQLAYYKYTVKEIETGIFAGTLEPTQLFQTQEQVNSTYFYDFGKALIDALANSEDGYIISGYLQRAYEGAPIFGVDYLAEDEVFQPVYDITVLQQIENSMAAARETSLTDANFLKLVASTGVTQVPKTNALVSTPGYDSAPPRSVVLNPMLSIRSEVPSVIDVVEATRMCSYAGPNGAVDCGSELLCYYTIKYPSVQDSAGAGINGVSFTNFNAVIVDATNGADVDEVGVILELLSVLDSFDWHPRVTSTAQASNSAGIQYLQTDWDFHNTTVLSENDIENLHRICLYSEFNSFSM